MLRRRLRGIYPVIVILLVALLAGLSSISGEALRNSPATAPIARLNASPTPTPVPTATSVPGTTDGIMVVGVVIALIIVVPILIQRRTWTKP